MKYEECKKIALEWNNDYNACNEYEIAYHFFFKDIDRDGESGIVVLKSNGKKVNWLTFITQYHPETNPKEIVF